MGLAFGGGGTNHKVVGDAWVEYNEKRNDNTKPSLWKGNLRFDERLLISYREIIAAYQHGPEMLFLVYTDYNWSPTTNRHLTAVYRAKVPKFQVPRLTNDAYAQQINLAKLLRDFHEFAHRARRGWKEVSEWRDTSIGKWQGHLTALYGTAEDYVKVSGADGTTLEAINLPALITEIDNHRTAKCKAFMDPKAVEARARSRARRIAIKVLIPE